MSNTTLLDECDGCEKWGDLGKKLRIQDLDVKINEEQSYWKKVIYMKQLALEVEGIKKPSKKQRLTAYLKHFSPDHPLYKQFASSLSYISRNSENESQDLLLKASGNIKNLGKKPAKAGFSFCLKVFNTKEI